MSQNPSPEKKSVAKYRQADSEAQSNNADDSALNGSSRNGATREVEGGLSPRASHRGRICQNFWHRSSTFERFLTIGIAILALIVIILIIVHTTTKTSVGDSQICLTPSCITAASTILSYMDHQVNPCDDFYQYACGNWLNANAMPEEQTSWSGVDIMEMKVEAIIREALEDTSTKLESKAEKNARVYYRSCMDKDEVIEKIGVKPLLDLLQKAGGWGISGEFVESKWDLQTSIENLHGEYRSADEFFRWEVCDDEKDSSRQTLQIDQTTLVLERKECYENRNANNTILNPYLEYMTQVGVLLGGEENVTRRQMKKVLELEAELAKLVVHGEARRDFDAFYNKMTLEEFQQVAPFLDWHKYFSKAFHQIHRNISTSQEILVPCPEYFGKLSALVRNYLLKHDGKRILSNYIACKVVDSLVPYLPKAFREAKKKLRKTIRLYEMSECLSTWEDCVSDTLGASPMGVGAMFVKKAFNKGSKFLAKQVLDDVREAFKANLKQLSWMDEETRQLVIDKADAMTELIGFPDYLLDPAQMDKIEHVGLVIKDNEYLENKIRVDKFNHIENMKLLGQPVDNTKWDTSPGWVNAYYSFTRNQIVFPAAYLQPPLFRFGYPMTYNYGSLGSVMGHELIHGFDDQGRKFDKSGILNQWWKNSTIKKFESLGKCYVDQYSVYEPIKGHHINGEQTLSENIADNGGVKSAYHAYQKWMEIHPNDPVLPGINMTSNQLFFLGFAQAWCSHITNSGLIDQLLVDTHCPNKYRVIGSLTNSHEFAREFKCPAGSPMNPKNKCEIW